jgi:hypothetical protein
MSLPAQKAQLKTNLQVNPKKYMKSQHIAAGPYVRSTSDLCKRSLDMGIFDLESGSKSGQIKSFGHLSKNSNNPPANMDGKLE